MGYTNYWTKSNKEITIEQFNKLADFANKGADILKKEGIEIADGHGEEDSPTFSANEIVFNGKGDLSCESLHLWRKGDSGESDFCKTNRRPYDVLVSATLVYAKELGILSEISNDDSDFSEGFALRDKILDNALDVKECINEPYTQRELSLLKRIEELEAKLPKSIIKEKSVACNIRYLHSGLIKANIPEDVFKDKRLLEDWCFNYLNDLPDSELLEGLRHTNDTNLVEAIFDETPSVECVEDAGSYDEYYKTEAWKAYQGGS